MLGSLICNPPPTPDIQWPTLVIGEESAERPQLEIPAGRLLPCFTSGRISKSSLLWGDGVSRWCSMGEIIATTPALRPIFGNGTKHSEQIIGYVTALYTYEPAEDAKEADCAFNAGDILVILKEKAGGWLWGYVGAFATGGLNVGNRPSARNIPGNYVQKISTFKKRS